MKIPVDTTFDNLDPYRVLGVAADAGSVEIRKAYLGLAKRHHPNLFATDPEKYRVSTALMQDINAAYDLLSDPVAREFWDRKHPGPPKPRPVAKPKVEPGDLYDASLVDPVIRSYNEFVRSLRTDAERQQAIRRIRKFQQSREGTAFVRGLVNQRYRKVMDFIKLGRRITVYDDGLVEIMFLYEGALEVDPSDIFITYAWLVFQREHGKLPAGDSPVKPGPRTPESPDCRAQTPRPRRDAGAAEGRANGVGSRIWNWLVSPYRSRRR